MIRIVEGDLLEQRVEAIVNASVRGAGGGFGLPAALSAGGSPGGGRPAMTHVP
ncbi:hypothetical protein [Stigmatella erecta]|uniref:Macro domain-containing protein n=1 Tax=Stigmatella erecta TaxID=83460 RepID=A0A1I0KV58_9BACT|nr:hypothetical protein [Stigmatella erecta]SEU30086.1 hypothetical protein SAMN05443639_11540 [Stigmatella erecta]